MDTVFIEKTSDGYQVHIPALRYDMDMFKSTGVIVYTNDGSYAEEVNKTGGISRKHVGYIEGAISKAISQWSAQLGLAEMKIEEA